MTAAVIGILAASSAVQAIETRGRRKASEKAARGRATTQQAAIAEQEASEERTRTRDIQRTGRRRRAGAIPRQRQTVLTGPLGIKASAPGTTGGKTLLGL